jgi:hypothetical protein
MLQPRQDEINQPNQKPQAHDLLTVAIEYARRGMSVIPVNGKLPSTFWKHFQRQPADESMLRRLFGRNGVTGLAVILGSASGGLACRDYDDADAYRRWADAHADLAATLPTVQTKRGYHVYFAGPDGFVVLDDGEYRATSGHYCLLPPSRHPDGPIYRWVVPLPDGPLPVLDPVSAGLLPAVHAVFPDTQETQADSSLLTPVLASKIQYAISHTQPDGYGVRNLRLFDLARHLKAIMPDASMDELQVIVRDWHSIALPNIKTKEWDETWVDFQDAFSRVRRPVGATLKKIDAAAKVQTPIGADANARLVELCRAMQAHHGPGRQWPLSCRVAGEKIGVSHVVAAEKLKKLRRKGIIELVKYGGNEDSGVASEYRFIGDEQGGAN